MNIKFLECENAKKKKERKKNQKDTLGASTASNAYCKCL